MLGGGAFGEVHKALNLKSEVECAVKIYQKRKIESNPNHDMLDELLKEELELL